jgi:parvulin-like peptidyl-prolyl isomerase
MQESTDNKKTDFKQAKIKGMLIVLNKIILKFPTDAKQFMIDEANKLNGLNGFFKLQNDLVPKVIFKPKKKKVRVK